MGVSNLYTRLAAATFAGVLAFQSVPAISSGNSTQQWNQQQMEQAVELPSYEPVELSPAPLIAGLPPPEKPHAVRDEIMPPCNWLYEPAQRERDLAEFKQGVFSQLESICLLGGFFSRNDFPTHLPVLHLNNHDYYLIGQEPAKEYGFIHLGTYNNYVGNGAVQLQMGLSGDYERNIRLTRQRALKEVLYEFFRDNDGFDVLWIRISYTDKLLSLRDNFLRERMHIQFETYALPPLK